MSKINLFHGGPLKTEYFDGHSFWTWKLDQAIEYMDSNDDLWVVELDKAAEVIVDEDDYVSPSEFKACETDDAGWELQTEMMRRAIADGATVILGDDGWIVVNVERLSPRRISKEEAETIESY